MAPGRVGVVLVGVAAGSLAGYSTMPAALWPALLVAAGSVLLGRFRPRARLVALLVLAAAAGGASAAARGPRGPLREWAQHVPRCDFGLRILEPVGTWVSLASVEWLSCAGTRLSDAGIVTVTSTGWPAGARVVAGGWLVPLPATSLTGARSGAAAQLNPLAPRVVAAPRGIAGTAARVRAELAIAVAGLGDEGALLRGMSIGDVSELPARLAADFRRAGLTHLVAVSGSNVVIVLAPILVLMRRRSLRARVAVALVALAAFVVLVGPEASVLRAAAMAAIGLVALVWGIRASPSGALALALVVLLLVRPSLVGSVGLALSAAATAGIVVLAPSLVRALAWAPRPVAVVAAATIAAQLAVAPILIAIFGRVSLVAPVANLLAAPAVAPVTILGLAAGAAGALWRPAGRAIARLGNPFAAWIAEVARSAARPAWAEVTIPPTARPGAAAVAVAIFLAGWAWSRRRRVPLL